MSDGKVIRVVFGPGGGRIEPTSAAGPGTRLSRQFSRSDAARVLGVSLSQLRRLEREGIASPSGRIERQPAYTFADVAELRAIAGLLQRGVRIGAVVAAVHSAREKLTCASLSEFRFELEGQRIVVHLRGGSFEPLSGQTLLAFEDKPGAVVRVMRPSHGGDRARRAYELYLQASEIDEAPASMEAAERLYRRAIELDPYLAIAYTNLGNIRFRRHDPSGAEPLYRKALELDSRQPEAQYNLGYLTLEAGDAAGAIPMFVSAIECDPKFADAYFNLATALEQAGRAGESERYWRGYLALEPHGTWSEIARRHLR